MTEQILTALGRLGIEQYQINEKESESLECFFVRKKLDLKRRTNVTEREVTVYREFEKDGVRMLGSSDVQIHPGMTEEEMEEALQGAYYAASFVCNPYYELYRGQKEVLKPSASGFAGKSLEENMKRMTEALFAADQEEDVFLNSAEVFLRHWKNHILNSAGVDVAYETYDVWGEYVVQCTEPQDVESYHQFSYQDPETEALKKDVQEAMEITRARARAVRALPSGEYTVLLSGSHVATLMNYYLGRSNTAMVYQKYSNFEVGGNVQGEEIKGDALTILLKARSPYSPEGIPMTERVLLQEGKLMTLHGNARFAYYLGVEPTGLYRSISVPVGETPLEELKKGPYLHLVSFSDFQMNGSTGYFGGEIRLAFWCDGKTVIPVTGGSVNGNLLKLQGNMVFSKERYRCADYNGPFAVRMEGVSVAGALDEG